MSDERGVRTIHPRDLPAYLDPGGRRTRVLLDPLTGHAGLELYEVELPPGASSEPHSRPHPEALIVVHGVVGVDSRGTLHRAGPGTIVVIPEGVEHRHVNVGIGTARFIGIFAPPTGHASRVRERQVYVDAAATAAADPHPLFEDIAVGDTIPPREFGPLGIVDTVRWAGVQENAERLHWDRDHARSHSGMRTFIASGAYRQAMLARTLTDWIGPRGWLRRMAVRHLAPTHEGDVMRFTGTVVERSPDAADPWVACEVEARDQNGERVLSGRCTVQVAARAQRSG